MASKLLPAVPRRTKPLGKKGPKFNRNTIGSCTDIHNDWSYLQPLSLPEFVEQYNDKLPLTIEVKTGYLGECSRLTLSQFEKLDIHFVKCTNVVNAKLSALNVSIPVNSILEFSLLYNPNDNVDEAFRGFTFETVADLLRAKIQPKFVCCMKSWKNDKYSISDRELLIIKGKCAVQKTSDTQGICMVVYSMTSSTEITLPLDCEGHLTTNPNYLHLYLAEYMQHVTNLFPCEVCLYTQKPGVRMHIEGMPQRFTTSVITLTGTSTETTLVASSALPGLNDTIMEIPIDIPEVKIAVLESTDTQQKKQLYENSCQVLQNYNPRNVLQCVKDAKTEEDYTIQSQLYSAVRNGYEKDGIQFERVYDYIDSTKQLLKPRLPLPPRPNRTDLSQSSRSSEVVVRRDKPNEKIIPSHPSTNVSPVELDSSPPDDLDSPAHYTTMISARTDQTRPEYHALIGKIEELQSTIQVMQNKVERIDGIEVEMKKLSLMLRNVQDAIGIKDTEPKDEGTTVERNCQYLSKMTSNEITNLLKAMGLHQYVGAFENERVDGNLMLALDNSMLSTDLKVDVELHRIRLLKVISGKHSAKHILEGEDPYLP